jgi:hypothetical protein
VKEKKNVTLTMAKIILSSTTVDSHGDVMAKSALDGMADIMNGERKVKWTIDHLREIPPLGFIGEGKVIPQRDIFLLQGETFKHDYIKEASWNKDLLIEGYNVPISYVEVEDNPNSVFSISIDSNNLGSHSDLTFLENEFDKLFQSNDALQVHGRKSQVPSPELIIVLDLVKWGMLLYNPVTKKFAEKFVEKFAEDTYDFIKEKSKPFRESLLRAVKLTRAKSIPKNKSLKTVFQVHGKPHIELIASDNTGENIAKGISFKNMSQMYETVKDFEKLCDVVKIQFTLSPKGKWIFSYLYTSAGETIGTKTVFKKRDRLVQRLKIDTN